MLVMTNVTYPAVEIRKAIQIFTSPDFPKRPEFAKEIASFVYTDASGNHVVFLLDVEDARLGQYLDAQAQRTVHFTSRVPGSHVDVHLGRSVMDAIGLVAKELS